MAPCPIRVKRSLILSRGNLLRRRILRSVCRRLEISRLLNHNLSSSVDLERTRAYLACRLIVHVYCYWDNLFGTSGTLACPCASRSPCMNSGDVKWRSLAKITVAPYLRYRTYIPSCTIVYSCSVTGNKGELRRHWGKQREYLRYLPGNAVHHRVVK